MAKLINQIKGHQSVISSLLDMQRRKRLHPVLLFLGPSGVGKKKIALALAQSLVCETAQPPCGVCGPCIRVEKNSSENVQLIQPQGSQIKIEQTREVQNWLSLQSLGKSRVVILDEADKLNPQAANSLLKTLEEPPPHTYFILIAQSQSSLLSTIRSRAQTVRFGALSQEDLKELTGAAEWALISSQGQLHRLTALMTPEYDSFRKSWLEVFLSTSDPSKRSWAFLQCKEMSTDRETALQMISLWQQFVHDVSFLSTSLSPVIHSDRLADLKEFPKLSESAISKLSQIVLQSERDVNANVDRGIVLENLWWQTQRALQ